MATVGGEKHRGYYEGRVRDKNLLVFQGEYRTNVGKYRVVGFAGAAWTSDEVSNYKLKEVLPTIGLGFRLPVTKHCFMLRVDAAYGIYGPNLYVGGGEAY